MPTASATLPDGTKVTIEGTADEIAAVLQRLSERPDSPAAGSETPSRRRGEATRGTTNATRKAKGPADYIRELIADDFFKTKRGLGDVQKKLEEGAHIYPVTHLSPSLFRLVRAKELRRIKEGGTWKYVNP